MYIIVMNEDKTLVASKRINLYEGDNLADKLMFLLPQTYKEIELSECIVRLNYTDLNGEEISEILVKDEELYKDRLCYRYPVDSRFTEYYRDIVYDISFSVAEDVDGDGTEDDVLFHTENHMIRILPRPDSIVHEDPIQKDAAGKIQKEMLELEHRIIALEENGLDVKDVVKYTEQDLTEEQKIQARKNIDAISKDDVVVKQSDWEQNDETAPDYIKNRPFYHFEEIEDPIFDQDITLIVRSESYGTYAYYEFYPNFIPVVKDEMYVIYIDDITLYVKGFYGTSIPSEYHSVLGENIFLYNDSFVLYDLGYNFKKNCHLKICKYNSDLKQIDEKFIPNISKSVKLALANNTATWSEKEKDDARDTLGVIQSDWNQMDNSKIDHIKNRPMYSYFTKGKMLLGGEILNNKGIIYLDNQLSLIPGKEYVVTIRTKDFIIKCGETLKLTGEDVNNIGQEIFLDNYAFVIVGYVYYGMGSMYMAIYEFDEVVVKLDEKYMPDDIVHFNIEETLELPDVTISSNDDGKGNVNIEFTGVEITDDENGNIGIESEYITVIDDSGNIKINL